MYLSYISCSNSNRFMRTEHFHFAMWELMAFLLPSCCFNWWLDLKRSALTLRKWSLNYCLLLFLSFRMVCVCWFLDLHWRGVVLVALKSKVVPHWGRLWPTLYTTFSLLPWFSSSAITKSIAANSMRFPYGKGTRKYFHSFPILS